MQVEGGRRLIARRPDEEGRHAVGDNEFWQESVVLVWWDLQSDVGGFHRIGHEPHWRDGPIISLFNNIFTPNYIYKDTSTLSLRDSDQLSNGLGGGDTCRFEYTDHASWTITAPNVSAELHVMDSHTPVDIYPKTSDLVRDFAPEHMEVGGTVNGTLTVKGQKYEINGLAFRDHGWGKREWNGIVSHRWIAMSFGNEMTVLVMTFHSPSNQLAKVGCVIRNNTLTYTKEIDVVTYLEADGLTHRGGHIDLVLTSGERMSFECAPLQKGVVSWIHGIAVVDTICRVTCGNLVGICDFEITNNALRGSYRPCLSINAIEKNGLHAVR